METVSAAGLVPSQDKFAVNPRTTLAFRALKAISGPVLAHGLLRVHVEGKEHLPKGACILVANHTQWIDPLLILATLPANPRIHILWDPGQFIARHPHLWGWVSKVAGIIPVDRDHKNMKMLLALDRKVQECIRAGGLVLVFPEGQYQAKLAAPEDLSRDGGLIGFNDGAAHFARVTGVPVVPIAISGVRDLWLGKRVALDIGVSIDPQGMSKAEITHASRQRIASMIRPNEAGTGPRLFHRTMTVDVGV